jgi:polyadenylate-binding protein 2
VDWGATPAELETHFKACGAVNRITIPTDRMTGRAKGYAYVEFAEVSAIEAALKLAESSFRGRPLKVSLPRMLDFFQWD